MNTDQLLVAALVAAAAGFLAVRFWRALCRRQSGCGCGCGMCGRGAGGVAKHKNGVPQNRDAGNASRQA